MWALENKPKCYRNEQFESFMEGQVKQQSLNRTVSAESACRLQWEGALEAGNQQDLRSVSAQDLDVIP